MFKNILNNIEKKAQICAPEITSLAIVSGMFSSILFLSMRLSM